ncbi:hypothetical protein GMDG_02545 [Pseudogymnoascus destructans 20631-21]|uniref:Major facilitator superfamily (MFS) profile domain-containing protein n=2 Tax=Pseudogymnoascus destructans TaxID=655981 RepID=L8G2B5_PSED2|nr:hypothetical protein GMDG_02545 [Pseudogymnoascus destructans 20631-21]
MPVTALPCSSLADSPPSVIQAAAEGNAGSESAFGAAGASMVFVFTSVFGATWLTVPWLYPAEIFPLTIRAKGNALGVVGWSIGNGWPTLLCPVMFEAIGEKTLYIFGIANAITLPMVWALYPESNQRTLEQIDLLFSADTPWNWAAEKNFKMLMDEGGLSTAAHAPKSDSVVLDGGEKGVGSESA